MAELTQDQVVDYVKNISVIELSQLVDMTDATVVMSRSAADLLSSAYGVDRNRVHVIPHGVPELPGPGYAKNQ